MTPEEQRLLLVLGHNEMKNVTVLFFMAVAYGIFLCLTPLALIIMSRRGRTRAVYVQIGVILLLFVSVTVNTACVLGVILLQLSRGFTRNLDEPLLQRFLAADQETMWMFVYQTWAQPIQFVAGDAIVVWRAWTFWRGRRAVQYALLFVLFADAAMAIAYGAWTTRNIYDSIRDPGLGASMLAASTFLSFGVNLVATMAIGFKALQNHRRLAATFSFSSSIAGSGHRVRRTESVFFILVESGALLCVCQFIYAILSVVDNVNGSPLDWASSLFGTVSQMLAALNPVLVILLVRLRLSILDSDQGATTTGGVAGIERIALSQRSRSLDLDSQGPKTPESKSPPWREAELKGSWPETSAYSPPSMDGVMIQTVTTSHAL
ncbi:hypothetical protein BD626DRAFT_560096 [Schizophyllum amplum]|uniref:Uncharacterized protein n=1 Tax=Schizophyllum amplum TaxID=97359 RepID=A0A550C0N4_9AGAR|nr:hypothetical protein BD626DRAFT_560096 [Auriculariopsis ampla]